MKTLKIILKILLSCLFLTPIIFGTPVLIIVVVFIWGKKEVVNRFVENITFKTNEEKDHPYKN